MNWLAVIGAVGGSIGALSAIVTTLIAFPTLRANKDNTAASKKSAEAAEMSAKAAQEAAAEAARLSKLEHDIRHDDLAPKMELQFEMRESPIGGGNRDLFAVVTLQRTYRVRGFAHAAKGRWNLSVPPIMQAGVSESFQIEKLPPDRDEPQARELKLEFWPPASIDPVEYWTCGCDRPVVEDSSEIGHWRATRTVKGWPKPGGVRF